MTRHQAVKNSTDPSQTLQELLDRSVQEDPAVHGGILLVDAPGFQWKGASGVIHPDTSFPLAPDDQFVAASITKMITATSLMLLFEEGLLDLDARVGHYLPERLLAGLHVFREQSYEQEITVRQLLNHTSGVADFFGDGDPGEDGWSPFVGELLREPEKFWNPVQTLRWTTQSLMPVFPPGQGWHYSDTGYLLIGLIIETLSGKPLHEFLKEKLFIPLGMNHTHLLFCESSRSSFHGRSLSHAYMGNIDYTLLRSMSADWAGGGLISTAPDLDRFLRTYAADGIFCNRSTKSEMLAWVSTGEEGIYYGLGVRRFLLDELGIPGVGQLWGHTGFVKAFMLYWPDYDTVLCGTMNHSDAQGVFSRLRPVSAIIPATIRHLQDVLG